MIKQVTISSTVDPLELTQLESLLACLEVCA